MAQLTKYGFIFKGPGYKEMGEINQMNSNKFKATIAAVPSVDSACKIAKKLIEEGVQLIELCGGFDQKDLNQINNYIDNSIPIGRISFNKKERNKLVRFFNQ